ncbi:MAG: hypothetical protein J6K74_07905 [Marinifilaceae bacterium]|nr:hypothetical protein [Marinifilaceae bacterium]
MVKRIAKGIPGVVLYEKYSDYLTDSEKKRSEFHLVKEGHRIIVGGETYSSNKFSLCGSDSANSNGWYRFGTIQCNNTDNVNVNIIASIMETFNSPYSGIFVLQARHNSAEAWTITKLQWLSRIGFSTTSIRCIPNGDTIALYAYKTTTQYSRLAIKILTEYNYNSDESFLTLNDSSSPESNTPIGININAECVTKASIANEVVHPLQLNVTDTNSTTINYNGSAPKSISFPIQNIQDGFTGTSDIALRQSNRTFCAIANGGNNIIDGTPYRIIKLEDYSVFNRHSPQNGDLLFLWLKNSVSPVTSGYPVYIPSTSSGENSFAQCIHLYHGQSAGTPKEWANSTSLNAGFYLFVYCTAIQGSNATTAGGWVFLYRNVSTT